VTRAAAADDDDDDDVDDVGASTREAITEKTTTKTTTKTRDVRKNADGGPAGGRAIAKQIEFYFSDANVVTDAWLLGKIRADAGGWVDLDCVCASPRVKQKLRKRAWRDVVPESLRMFANGEVLEVSEDGERVRRVEPVPKFDVEEIQTRTCCVENLSEWTVEAVRRAFSEWEIVNVKIRHPGQGRVDVESVNGLDLLPVNSNRAHALVEFATAVAAVEAAAKLDNPSDWRNGMRVRILLKPGKKKPKKTKTVKQGEDSAVVIPGDTATEVDVTTAHESGETSSGCQPPDGDELSTATSKKKSKKKKPDYSKWASVAAFNENKTSISSAEDGQENTLMEELSKKLVVSTTRNPTMPDGSPGFRRIRTCVAPALGISKVNGGDTA